MTASPVFALPPRLSNKADPSRISADERHFAALADALAAATAAETERLDDVRRAPAGPGQAALDRDLEIHRRSGRLRTLGRFGMDVCLGRMVPADGDPVYIGRFGLAAPDGRRLLVDWRAPAAEPFFAATRRRPLGLSSRRRYRWSGGRIVDYWDEVFDEEARSGVSPDDQSAFLATLGASRSPRMRDVLATIQSDQDAIIRARSRGTLVVDGGPGTGKTVVALHRAAYLMYADPRLARGRGGILFVGPHPAYLSYVEDVLPGLGEESVRLCTLADLVAEGRDAREESDGAVARLKSSAQWAEAVAAAVRFYEEPPRFALEVHTPWADLRIDPADWAEAFAAPEEGTGHNDARDEVWDALVDILADRLDDPEVPRAALRRALAADDELVRCFTRAWPLLDARVIVGDLWSTPAFLRRMAPWLAPDEVAALQREDPDAWTRADLPLLDAARRLLGDPRDSARRRRADAEWAAEAEERARVADELIAADDSEMLLMSVLRGSDAQASLASGRRAVDPNSLEGPFGHIVVDEAQELTDAEWRMLLDRCPSRSFTVVGDRAQARRGFGEPWAERLQRAGLREISVASLTVNYRTPAEVMAVAEPAIRAALPNANVPASVRSSGIPVRYGSVADLGTVLDAWLTAHDEGTACVIGSSASAPTGRVRVLDPGAAKGLEFDLVVLVRPESFGDGVRGAVDRYVAMTRSTSELVVLA
jgi:hypothetical protein